MREAVQTYLGRTGDPLDKGLTVRDLKVLGLIDFVPGTGGRVLQPGLPGAWLPPVVEDKPDLTPPPTPTGFVVTAGITNVFVDHNPPIYTEGRGHDRTILYGAMRGAGDPAPTFADAVRLADFEGQVYAYATNPATTWHLWIKWRTVDMVESVTPAGGVNGLAVRTGEDVAALLAILTGQLTTSELHSSLSTPIGLIEGSGPGSVNARIASEASTRSGVDGYLGAQQNVRIDVAGHVSGYGIAGSSPNGSGAGATSAFGVRANSFFVAPPALAQATAPTANLYDGFVWLDTSVTPSVTRYRSGASWTTTAPALPFIIQTTPTTINGVAVPTGIYMTDAYIRNGSIANAKIGNLAVDDAKIANLSVSKILAGSMVVGQYINSANFVDGTQGWSINAAGNVQFNNAIVRGGIYASFGTIGGINISGGSVSSANWVWDQSGFYFGSDGNVYVNSLRARGAVMGGAYSSYSWPAAGQTGYYLGAEGLLVGNANNGRYFQIDSAGNISAPNFNIVNGSAYFAGTVNATGVYSGHLEAATGTIRAKLTADNIDAVNTLNVAGGAITTTRYAAWPAVFWWRMGAPLASIGFSNIPAGSSGISLRGLATVRLTAGEFAGTLTIYIVRNNDAAVIGTGIAILDNMGGGTTSVSLPIAVDAFDPNPIVGYSEYSIRVGQATPASGDTGGQLYAASISGTGGKR